MAADDMVLPWRPSRCRSCALFAAVFRPEKAPWIKMVLAMPTLVTRHFNVFDPVVTTVGKLVAGTQGNIIPANATFDLTLRTFSPDHKERLLAGAFIMLGATTAADPGAAASNHSPRAAFE
ncbi:hypothetical protein [Arthrobacter sp. A5]|uniref:hypothetical protein n=1 Tax=Arthrobacter sp. A5 TaxID=576926 RepID=UPI003DA8CB67